MVVPICFIRSHPDGISVILFSYFAEYLVGEVKLDGDAMDFKWVTVEETNNYDLINGIWDEIREVEEILKSRQ